MNQEIYGLLLNSLNPCSGVVQKIEKNNKHESKKSTLQFQICWKNGISFSVQGWPHFGWYFVEKDNQTISALFHYNKVIDEITLSVMQHLINEIETGKYRNKKTTKDKIHEIVQTRNLISYMNKTKWNEFIDDISEIQDLPIKYKTLFDEQEPQCYWTIDGDEHFFFMDMATIEWFKVLDTITITQYIGRLIEPKIEQHSVKNEIEIILKKYSIFYEYDEDEKAFVIYGYK